MLKLKNKGFGKGALGRVREGDGVFVRLG